MIRTRLVPLLLLVPVLALAAQSAETVRHASARQESASRRRRIDQERPGALSHSLWQLPWPRRAWVSRAGPDRGARRHARRAAVPDDSQRRARHRNAAPAPLPDDDVLMVMAYLRNMNAATPAETPIGNVANGSKLFAAQCSSCHRVGDTGGWLGPDLSRVGAARSRETLTREIRTPSDWMPPAYESVTLVTRDGQKIRGVKKNEDPFSIQIMDMRERIQGYLKSDLQQVIFETDVGDAGIRSGAIEPERSERSHRLLEHAAWQRRRDEDHHAIHHHPPSSWSSARSRCRRSKWGRRRSPTRTSSTASRIRASGSPTTAPTTAIGIVR